MQCVSAILACPSLQYFSILSHKRYDFRKKKKVTEHKRCVLISSTVFIWNIFPFYEELNETLSYTYIGLRVKYPSFLSDFNNTSIFRHIFEKYSNIKFHENPSSGGRVAPCGLIDGQTDTTKIIVAYRNFANAPKNSTKHNCRSANFLLHSRSNRCCTAHCHSCFSFIVRPKVKTAQASTKEIPKCCFVQHIKHQLTPHAGSYSNFVWTKITDQNTTGTWGRNFRHLVLAGSKSRSGRREAQYKRVAAKCAVCVTSDHHHIQTTHRRWSSHANETLRAQVIANSTTPPPPNPTKRDRAMVAAQYYRSCITTKYSPQALLVMSLFKLHVEFRKLRVRISTLKLAVLRRPLLPRCIHASVDSALPYQRAWLL
jgi:hypothetical protein